MTRIPPLEPPYEPDAARQLEDMMPPGVPPILQFRTFTNNLAMSKAMGRGVSCRIPAGTPTRAS
jgi:hypothetical protein